MSKNNYSLISSIQLAKICGVSQGTVDRALNNRPEIKKETKERILEAARKYGYLPNVSSPHESGTGSRLIGIVLDSLDNGGAKALTSCLDALCRKHGYNTIIMLSGGDGQTEIGCINQLIHIGAEALAIFNENCNEEYARYLTAQKMPIVTLNKPILDIPFMSASSLDEKDTEVPSAEELFKLLINNN